MTRELPVNTWAKLIAQNPDQQNINFPCKLNQKNKYTVDSQWTIYQSQDHQTWIINLSTTLYILVDDTWLGEYEKKQLIGGERIAFNQTEKNLNNSNFDYYVFSLVSLPSKNELKRSRDDPLNEPITFPSSSFINKSLKSDLEEDLKCALCYDVIYKCATLIPCQHNFCSVCLSDYLQSSTNPTTCPLCRVEISSLTKNLLLQGLIQKIVENSPNLQRSQEEYLDLDKKDLISKGYNIIRETGRIYIGFSLNGQKEGEGRLIFSNGDRFQGSWKNNVREGKGVLTFENGDILEGEWTTGLLKLPVKIRFSNGDMYEGEIKDFKMHGKGVLIMQNGERYEGQFVNNFLHGFGKCTWTDGSKYEGDWANGYQEGFGRMKYDDGDVYIGEWKNEMREGKGTFTDYNGNKYEGEFANDLFNGLGKYSWADGGEYKGSWKDDDRHGFGIMRYSDGEIYTGEWKDDLREGKGVLTFKTGNKYEGEWKNDYCHGKGKHTWASGDVYEGNYVNGCKNGFGIMRYSSYGTVYEGEWKDGKKCWKGVLTLQDGTKCNVSCLKDSVVRIEYQNGAIYEGEITIKTFEKKGKGILIFNNGDRYEGTFLNDKFDGFGQYIWSDGTKYSGHFSNGDRNGKGTLEFSNGTQFIGFWVNGNRSGAGTIRFGEQGKCEGNWIEDILQPQVRIRYDNGNVYQGEIDNEKSLKRHGKGTLIYANRDIYIGDFESDKRHGYGQMDCLGRTHYKGRWEDDEKAPDSNLYFDFL